ncbi:MAG: Bax inhibitor-1/YccA family protein [Planctomycetaceae bacterium]|nr:Bax inhibitor-1/YccA family protein [Planctomycetaceae bacterium]
MRTANPALNDKTFDIAIPSANAMTLSGTVTRCFFLLALCVGAAAFTWMQTIPAPGQVAPNTSLFLIGGAVVGMIFSLITIFKPTWAAVTGSIYALAEGVFLGALSATFESRFPGIAAQAAGGTFGTLAGLLLIYATGLVKPSENFKLGILAATSGIALVYLASMVLGFFGIAIPYIHQSGVVGIGFSLFVVVIAALNLVLDFDFIENGCEAGAPRYMEWYAAFGLLVTLVWLYVEILRLLSKLRSRD